MDATLPNFVKKTFVNSHKTSKFVDVFSFKSFLLYGIYFYIYIAEDDVHSVYREVLDLAGRWRDMCIALGLHRLKDEIAAMYPGSPRECLQEVIVRWLRKVHNVDRYGLPTWKTLVKAVADKAGGENPALAEQIANNHKGNITLCN